MSGKLYIIAGPIGNLEDITFRAVRILKEEVKFACCEDTRQSRKLLNHYEIDMPLIPFHSHSYEGHLEKILDRLENETGAYLTDSGTPCISDPGSKLVSTARKRGIEIIPLPGPSALTALASVSGFAGKNIIFAGFVSKKPGRRIGELEDFKTFDGTIIIYESPHRILKTLAAIAEVFPGKNVVIGREMTKFHEQFICATPEELSAIKFPEKGE